jgi:hypothetical protein
MVKAVLLEAKSDRSITLQLLDTHIYVHLGE